MGKILAEVFLEIAMAIGTSLQLNEMLRTALLAIMRKLNFTSGMILASKEAEKDIQLLLAFPKRLEKNQMGQQMQEFARNCHQGNLNSQTQFKSENDQTSYYFPLPGFGVLVLAKAGEKYKEEVHKNLEQICDKLSQSAFACLNYEQLQDEIEHRTEVEISLREHQEHLEERYIIQKALSQVLALSQRDISLMDQLSESLELMLHLPWFTSQGKGAIFLDGEGGLSPFATKGLGQDQLNEVLAQAKDNYQDSNSGKSNKQEVCEFLNVSPFQFCRLIQFGDQPYGYLYLFSAQSLPGNIELEQAIDSLAQIMGGMIRRSRTEEVLLLEKRRAEAANEAKSRFLTMMSHELRTPINGIMGMAQLLGMSDLTEEQIEWCKIIVSSSTSLVDILTDILDFSKIEAGTGQVHPTRFQMGQILTQVEQLFQVTSSINGNEFKFWIDPSLSDELSGDAGRLKQILTHLVGNAVKFTHQGLVSVRVEAVKSLDANQLIVIQVSDNGIGMDEEEQKYIFEPFRQVDDSHTRKYGGTGLGLTIVKQNVELMGGKISLKSEKGKGSQFNVEIPLRKYEHEVIEPQMGNMNEIDLDEKPLTALLVEDDLINQKVITHMLKKLNISVLLAENGKEAVEKSMEETYDVILMDILMPELDGYKATSQIRQEPKSLNRDTPIIAVTAKASNAVKAKCLEVGMNQYLVKPLDFGLLRKEIERLRAS